MVRAYLPPLWCLVVVGITTSVVDIVQDEFQGSQVIAVDWSPDRTRFLYNTLEFVFNADMHILQHVLVDQSIVLSSGEASSRVERRRTHVQEHGSEEDMHDQVTGEAKQNKVEPFEEELEDDSTRAAVEIRRPRDETTDLEDEDMLDEDTSRDEETSEEDNNNDGKEPSGTNLNSESSHWSRRTSIDISDYDYCPSRSSHPRQSLDESATTT